MLQFNVLFRNDVTLLYMLVMQTLCYYLSLSLLDITVLLGLTYSKTVQHL